MSFRHRSMFGGKKKPFKGKSKGKLKRLTKGKVDLEARASIRTCNDAGQRRARRLNMARQAQRERRSEVLRAKRIGSRSGPPRVVAIIPLSQGAAVEGIRELILSRCTELEYFNEKKRQYSCKMKVDNRECGFIILDPERNPTAILDAAKAADVVIPVICSTAKGELDIDDLSDHLVTILKAQGLPSAIGVVTGGQAKKGASLKLCKRWFQSVFEDIKVVSVAAQTSIDQLIRWASAIKLTEISWRNPRPYLLAEEVQYTAGTVANKGTLSVTGFLRGSRGLSARQLVHITGYGDYQVSAIEAAGSIPKRVKNKAKSNIESNGDTMVTETGGINGGCGSEGGIGGEAGANGVYSKSTEQERVSLQTLNPIDHTAENIITEEELKEDEDESKKVVPPGMEGIIKNVWDSIISDDDEEEEDDLAQFRGMGKKTGSDEEMEQEEQELDHTLSKLQESMNQSKAKTLKPLSKEEIRKLERDEVEFPDEVELHPSTTARTRFAKFRGLKSFRNSEWDNRENLPVEYGQIFQFQNLQAAKKRVMTTEGCGCGGDEAPSGLRVRIRLEGVLEADARAMCVGGTNIMLWGLFLYERKVSVSHFLVKRHQNECDDPVKAKEPMIFSVGFRRFRAKPIYSQDCKSNKFKTDRYLQLGCWVFASVYTHMNLTPSTVLMFRCPDSSSVEKKGGMEETKNTQQSYNPLVASGSLSSVDPDRLLIKRVILTGAPISVSKRVGVVRHMFYKPDDVRWFRPVELWTKHGLTGHIQDPHGTKGYMKCTFDGHIKNHDTVCMSLYKRQYPPFDEKDFE